MTVAWAGYDSRFVNWDARASVRSKPRRLYDRDGRDALFFPPESVPALAHPLVLERGPGATELVLQHSLYQYLHFTTVLEQVCVLPVTAKLSLGMAGLELPDPMRSDAYKISTDEAWHAQFTHDFAVQVSTVTGVAAEALVEPAFIREHRRLRALFDAGDQELVDLTFAIVSETLVSALLADIPNDRRLARPIREVVADHAADEGRHHAYFQNVLRLLWPRLSPRDRGRLGTYVPAFVHAFLDPDLPAVRAALAASGFTDAEAAVIVSESYDPESSSYDVRRPARSTVRGFRDVGATADPRVRDAFLIGGLTSEDGA